MLNGYGVSWSGESVVETMVAVAAGRTKEDELAAWFRAGLAELPPDARE